jgi:hypothetical protein
MSTLKVDTYLTRGGASEIAIDKLKGVTAAGSMLVVGEGGTVTTNLQQGLCKSWINLTGTGTIAVNDSFNISSVTDIGTGNYRAYYTSNMSNVNYSVDIAGAGATAGAAASGKIISSYTEHNLANSVGISCFNVAGDAYEDPTRAMIQIAGDLA